MTQRKIVVGNWKMNMHRENGTKLAKDISDYVATAQIDNKLDIVICPPFTVMYPIADVLGEGSIVKLGAQNCSVAGRGLNTGDISIEMLKEIGCSYVILGHSERRIGHGETNETIKAKASLAHENGIKTIICVGETEAERAFKAAHDSVARQLSKSVPESANEANTVIAYEPVWAIGTGHAATSYDAGNMLKFIRETLTEKMEKSQSIPLLYGGSVSPEMADEFLGIDHLDGFLAGSASLSADKFWQIVQRVLVAAS